MDLFTIFYQAISVSWYLLPPITLFAVYKSAWFKGFAGEYVFNATVKLFLNKNRYYIFKDVTLYTENGSIQIDNVIVSKCGVFVVNKKNMKGCIFGNKYQKIWTQKTCDFRYKFKSPLCQNQENIETLQTVLGLDKQYIYSLVVFLGGSTFKTKMPDNIVHDEGYIRFIKSKKLSAISESCVNEILKIIERSQLVPSFNTRSKHVEYVCQLLSVKSIY